MNIQFRTAKLEDVPLIVAMLANDPLGKTRERFEKPLSHSYYQAFHAINSDPNNELIVARDENKLVGVAQVTFIPSITYQGSWRAQIEGVRTLSSVRGTGIGESLILHCIEKAKERNCHLVQLTTDKQRIDAKRFYESVGFVASHEGMKLKL